MVKPFGWTNSLTWYFLLFFILFYICTKSKNIIYGHDARCNDIRLEILLTLQN